LQRWLIRLLPRWGLTMAALVLMSTVSKAQLSPGELHRSHAFLEGLENCQKCHDPDRSKMPERCLDCHQALRSRIARGEGLHGRPGHEKCQKCHVEHQGRNYDLIYWEGGQDKFDHALTGYVLEGAHATVACRSCHQPGHIIDRDVLVALKVDLARTFLGLGQKCLDCHGDEHRGQLAATCRDCHTMAGWKPAPGFNHDKTHFRLTGAHVTTPCAKCHVTVVDHRTETDPDYLKFAGVHHELCTDCHKDIHVGRFGTDCAKCHNASEWKATDRAHFDHNRTRYPLTGMHMKVACEKCHRPGEPVRGGKFAACMDCHADYHKGQFVSRQSHGACEECHAVDGFTPGRFTMAQHDKTDYPLRGAHVAIPCNSCHQRSGSGKSVTIRFTFKSTRCLECHQDPHKPHLKKLIADGGCESCHTDDAWDKVHFDHDKTDYPLVGRHRDLLCRACHHQADGPKVAFQTLAKTCAECHQDIHRGQFLLAVAAKGQKSTTTNCERCHTPKSWVAERFNHDTDSSYKLEGGHRRVPCNGCHKPTTTDTGPYVIYKPLDKACKSCHAGTVTQEGLNKG
jgi:hypothetical protein